MYPAFSVSLPNGHSGHPCTKPKPGASSESVMGVMVTEPLGPSSAAFPIPLARSGTAGT